MEWSGVEWSGVERSGVEWSGVEWSDGDCAGHMRFRTGENQYCGNHNGSSAQTQGAHILAAAITMRFAAYHNHCFANHNGSNSNAQNRRGPQRRQRAPQPLLQSLKTAPATAERAGPPAATTRAAALSAVSGSCAGHCGESRAPSGDNARRSPFCSLWRLRRPLRREPGPQRRRRAPAATTRAAAPSAVSGDCAGHCGESRAPSGDNARRSPFCSLCRLRQPLRREPGPQRRQRAPQPLLQSLDTAPATVERRRSRSPCCSLRRLRRPLWREPGPQRRQRAPQPRLQSLETAPATAERAGPPAATTCAAAPSAVSGDCAGHCGCEV